MTDQLRNEALELIQSTMDEAVAAGERDANAMSLATVSASGGTSVRIVLLKDISKSGLVFYTNLESIKGRQLEANSKAALCFHWKSIAKQIRVEGSTQLVTDAQADAYFATRDRGSQIGAWASDQSAELSDRSELEARIATFEERFAAKPVERPPHWSGYCLGPDMIEIWEGKSHRLHVRWRYEASAAGWSKRLLYP